MTGKQLFVRSVLTAALPFVLIYAAIFELLIGIGSAFRYAWLEVLINIESYRDQMRREDY